MDYIFLLTFFLLTSLMIILYYLKVMSRSAEDVYLDLIDEIDFIDNENLNLTNIKFLSDSLGKLGLFSKLERKRFFTISKFIYISIIFIAEIIVVSIKGADFFCLGMTALLSWGIAVFICKFYEKSLKERFQYRLDFYLPLVMEKLVMATESGLDIISAVAKVVEIEKESVKKLQKSSSRSEIDPVTKLLDIVLRLSNSGMQFSQSLSNVANLIDNASLKHAFIHLALAQKEGGEIIMPLRELSDATQLQYQENVEEQIAKLPVKATLPLVLTFTGLFIFSITGSSIQVLKVTTSAIPH